MIDIKTRLENSDYWQGIGKIDFTYYARAKAKTHYYTFDIEIFKYDDDLYDIELLVYDTLTDKRLKGRKIDHAQGEIELYDAIKTMEHTIDRYAPKEDRIS